MTAYILWTKLLQKPKTYVSILAISLTATGGSYDITKRPHNRNSTVNITLNNTHQCHDPDPTACNTSTTPERSRLFMWRNPAQKKTWWRHQMETFSALLAICAGNSPVTGEYSAQTPVTLSFDVSFDLRLNKRLSKHPWGWWFETPSCPLWCHCNE